jgi:hypothetical protein
MRSGKIKCLFIKNNRLSIANKIIFVSKNIYRIIKKKLMRKKFWVDFKLRSC